jgi:pimeloyl-ACP methyl ester carboxylesterase
MTSYLDRDGIRLAYEVLPGGDPPLLLVHGWCDRGATMGAMAARLAGAHRVVLPDLRGHGDSDQPEGDANYHPATFAADLAALCDHLGVRGAVVAGHSSGGAIALELAARRPGLVAGIVALEGTAPMGDGIRAAFAEVGPALRTPAWREVMHGIVEANNLPSDDPGIRAAAHAEIDRLPQHVVAAVPHQMMTWDAEAAVRACTAPILYVRTASGAPADVQRLLELQPETEVRVIDGIGHDQLADSPEVDALVIAFAAAVTDVAPART